MGRLRVLRELQSGIASGDDVDVDGGSGRPGARPSETMEPPPTSSCHRLRWLEPTTIWVTCRRRAKSTRAWAGSSARISFHSAPTSAHRLPQCDQLIVGETADCPSSAVTWSTSQVGLDPGAILAARRTMTSVPGAVVTPTRMRSWVSQTRAFAGDLGGTRAAPPRSRRRGSGEPAPAARSGCRCGRSGRAPGEPSPAE